MPQVAMESYPAHWPTPPVVPGNRQLAIGHWKLQFRTFGPAALSCAGRLPPQRPPDVRRTPIVGSMQPCATCSQTRRPQTSKRRCRG